MIFNFWVKQCVHLLVVFSVSEQPLISIYSGERVFYVTGFRNGEVLKMEPYDLPKRCYSQVFTGSQARIPILFYVFSDVSEEPIAKQTTVTILQVDSGEDKLHSTTNLTTWGRVIFWNLLRLYIPGLLWNLKVHCRVLKSQIKPDHIFRLYLSVTHFDIIFLFS